jgi:hypothetical protein
MTATVQHALAFARHGHAVFPAWWPREHHGRLVCACRKGADCITSPAKHPIGRLVERGLLNASTDEPTIRKWFADEPAANLGVRTERLIVLDVDPRHDGDASLHALEHEHGELPTTWRALTGGGGEHVLFAAPDKVEVTSSSGSTNPVLGPGIDIRARGGYIIAPPSLHISGRTYAWSVDHHPAEVKLADPPAWLFERLAARTANECRDVTPPEVWQRLTRPVPAYPDAAAASVAGHLLRRWVDPYLVAGLLHAWNQTYVRPPLADDELRCILDRVVQLEDRRRDALQGGQHVQER